MLNHVPITDAERKCYKRSDPGRCIYAAVVVQSLGVSATAVFAPMIEATETYVCIVVFTYLVPNQHMMS